MNLYRIGWLWIALVCCPHLTYAGLLLEQAVDVSLGYQPSIALQEQVVFARRGQLKAAEGVFDTSVHSAVSQTQNRNLRLATGLPHHVVQCEVGASRIFQSGLRVTPLLSSAMIREFGQARTYNNSASIEFIYPLMRGREIAAVQTKANYHLEAEELRLLHQRMLVAQQVALAYWDLLMRQHMLQLWQQAKQRLKHRYSKSKDLLEAYQMTYDELFLQAKTQWLQSKQQLALSMNLSLKNQAMLDVLSSSFPEPKKREENMDELLSHVREKRADYQAIEKDQKGFGESILLARDAMRWRMDLGVTVRYQGWRGRNTATISGPNTSVSLRMDLPWQNRVASSQMVIAQSSEQQQAVQKNALLRQICTEINLKMSKLNLIVQRINRIQASVKSYELALSTQVDAWKWMDIHDRYVSAQVRDVQARSDYAKGLVQLRFAAGELLLDGRVNAN
ncbi:MAG: TolC family protein [Mariprofundaceae bacterium]|nr:TolC family protein [Mariprofundaceae bacterium]